MIDNNIYSEYIITANDIEKFKVLQILVTPSSNASDYIKALNLLNVGSKMIVQHTNGNITYTLGNLIDFLSSALDKYNAEYDEYYKSCSFIGFSRINTRINAIREVLKQLENIANQSRGTWSDNVGSKADFVMLETFY